MKEHMREIVKYLRGRGYSLPSEEYYSRLNTWQSWYRGKVASFHRYRQYNGRERISRERRSLGMAKCICEDWANLLLNEKVGINIDNPEVSAAVSKVLGDNHFRWRANQLIELTFALGTGAFVEFLENGRPVIDFIRSDMIFPLSYCGGTVTECAFASSRLIGNREVIYLNLHTLDDHGCYVIENHVFTLSSSGVLTPASLPDGVAEVWCTDSPLPLFQIIRPNTVNNIDPDSPMGISVFANAIDQLEGIDLIFDSYCNEFRLGKKRLIVPMSFAQIEMEADGITLPVFDSNDTEFFAVNSSADCSGQLQEINMDLRSDAHETALKTFLSALSMKCGMGAARYRFESGTVKTATEVISARSELYQNIRKHELILADALVSLCKAIALLLGFPLDSFSVDILFDDSIIEDSVSERERNMQEVRDGLMSREEYRQKWYPLTLSE
ncbi:MAG: phage portal protein [Oscillospiraceae bacterium]|nr:phage portal protein [Oscillospiraceae bacterium]